MRMKLYWYKYNAIILIKVLFMEITHQMAKKNTDNLLVYLVVLSSLISFMLIYFALSVYKSNTTLSSILFAIVSGCFTLFLICVLLLLRRKKEKWSTVNHKIRKNAVLMSIETSLILLFGGTAIVFISPFINEIHYLSELNYVYFLIAVSCFVFAFALPTTLLLALYGKKDNHEQPK